MSWSIKLLFEPWVHVKPNVVFKIAITLKKHFFIFGFYRTLWHNNYINKITFLMRPIKIKHKLKELSKLQVSLNGNLKPQWASTPVAKNIELTTTSNWHFLTFIKTYSSFYLFFLKTYFSFYLAKIILSVAFHVKIESCNSVWNIIITIQESLVRIKLFIYLNIFFSFEKPTTINTKHNSTRN